MLNPNPHPCPDCSAPLGSLRNHQTCPQCGFTCYSEEPDHPPTAAPPPADVPATPQETAAPKKCLDCGYSLKGLPNKHRCPECGLEFNRNTQVILEDPFGARIFTICTGISFLGLALGTYARVPHLILIMLFATISNAATVYRYRSNCNKAILSNSGMILLIRKRPRTTFPWNDVARLDWARTRMAIEIRGHDDNIIATIPADYFSTGKRATQFLRAAQRWKAIYDRVAALKQNNPSPPQTLNHNNA